MHYKTQKKRTDRTLFVFCVAVCLSFSYPNILFGAVRVNEIAWMGTAADANDEWIELYNDGDTAVSLSGWRLLAGDGTPAVTLEGTVAAGAYFLLERTNDESVPSVAAGLIYTGALGNEGEQLTLFDASGAVIDTVFGGDSWAIGGDNTTKATLQRTTTLSWITAPGTPGAVNASVSSAPPVSSSPKEGSASASSSSGTLVPSTIVATGHNQKPKIPERLPLISLEAPEDDTTPVGVTKTFSAQLFDRNGKETLAGRILWNFGDGTTAEGRTVSHAWHYPGEHRVTLFAELDLFRTPLRAEAYFTENITSARVSVSDARGVYTALTNHEAYDVDVSGWKLSSGDATFTLPRGTHLASGATIRFPRSATGITAFDTNTLALFYPSGARVSSDVSLLVPKDIARVASPLASSVSAPISEVLGDASRAPVTSKKIREDSGHQDAPIFPEATSTAPGTTVPLIASPASVFSEEVEEESRAALVLWIFFVLAFAGAGATAMILVRRAERPLAVAGYRVIDAEAKTRDN